VEGFDVKMEHTVNLDVGETIFFSSFRDHEVRKVMKGEREVLVAWIYKKT
jgi:predicted 2-oxoglutarate/Fe(II)-dependent dioxygenase YbiX